MSAQASLGNLPGSIRNLVLAASQADDYFGRTEKDKVEVQEWTTKVAQGALQSGESLKSLDSILLSRTFLVGEILTAADVAVFGVLHPTLSKQKPEEYYGQPCVTRYFDHLQSLPSVQKAASSVDPALQPVSFDLDNMPKLERKVEAPKKKAKAAVHPLKQSPTTVETLAAAAVPPAEAPVTAAPAMAEVEKPKKPAKGQPEVKAESKETEPKEKAGKKEGKEKEKGKKKPPAAETGSAAPPAADSGDPMPSMIDLRVGHIIEIQKHPDADGLYVEQIDVGEETGPRTVVSGLVHYVPIEKLRDRKVIVVCNLKPANMRGVKSHAMLLCATSKEGKDGGIEPVDPPAASKPGDRVYFEGEKYENATPLAQLNPKRKIFETIQPGFTTLDTREAAWIDPANGNSVHKIRTKDGVCMAATYAGASLS